MMSLETLLKDFWLLSKLLDHVMEQRWWFVGALFTSLSLFFQRKPFTTSLLKSQSPGTVAPQRANTLSLSNPHLPLESKTFALSSLFYILKYQKEPHFIFHQYCLLSIIFLLLMFKLLALPLSLDVPQDSRNSCVFAVQLVLWGICFAVDCGSE